MLKNQYKPQVFFHPGETLAEKLEEIEDSKERILDTGDPKNHWFFKHKLYTVDEAKQLVRSHVIKN